MIRRLVAWLGSCLALLTLAFAGQRWITRQAQNETEDAVRQQANEDTLNTRKRIDDATRDVPEPDAARERLQQFGAGRTPPKR